MNKMIAAIYTRVSTDNQAEVEFNSCETQELKIRSFISSQESMEIYKVYSDAGYSGADTNRPALIELVNDIRQGKINAVISYKIDRLTRSPRDFYQLIEVFEKHSVSFISVTERFDTSTPSGRLLRNIMLTFAQFERELISERIKDKMFERAKKGLWNCGRTPFGYSRENKKLIINPEEAGIIKMIFEIYASSGSTAEVYHKLKGQKAADRKGLPFSVETIAKILKNIVYIGKVPYHGSVYQGIHEPIISEALFKTAQSLHKQKVKKSKVENLSLLSGLVHCKECGSTMTFAFTNKKTGGRQLHYFYYRCSSIAKRDRSVCGTRQVSVDRLDGFVIENLDRIARDNFYLESLIFKLNHERKGRLKGVEPAQENLVSSPEPVKKALETIVQISKLDNEAERKFLVKKHIKTIIYSKKSIEVVLNYGGNGGENLTEEPASAAGVCAAANAGRRTQSPKNKAAASGSGAVCGNFLVDLRGVEPLSERLEARVSTSVAGSVYFAQGLTPGGVFPGLSFILFPLPA